MRLDELRFVGVGQGYYLRPEKDITRPDGRRVRIWFKSNEGWYRIHLLPSDGHLSAHEYPPNTWDHLDPIVAQAILYHLLSEAPQNKSYVLTPV